MEDNFDEAAKEVLIDEHKDAGPTFRVRVASLNRGELTPMRFREMSHLTEEELEEEFNFEDGLSTLSVWAYSVGHVYNDLWWTIWFMYLLYFLIDVVKASPSVATIAILSGQIADGLATNIIGFLIDKTDTKIGKSTPWYIFGTLLIIPSFLLTFNKCVFCDLIWGEDSTACNNNVSNIIYYLYYMLFPALFNIGWAAVQISTMSIVPTITFNQHRRDSLVNFRNAFTYVSNIVTLIIALTLFKLIEDEYSQFKYLVNIVTILGLLCTFFFLYGVKESKLHTEAVDKAGQSFSYLSSDGSGEGDNWKEWLKKPWFYTCGAVYMFTRMAINITMTLIPFYLVYVLKFEKSEKEPTPPQIAMVPLASYFSSMIFSFFLYRPLISHFSDPDSNWQTPSSRLYPLLIGVVLLVGSSFPFLIIQCSYSWAMYLIVPCQGIGLAIMLNIATSMISDMIGNNSKWVAFIYGTYSLFDKVMNGIILSIITSTVIQDSTWLRMLTGSLPILVAIMWYIFASIGVKYMPNKWLGKLSEF